jgi:hypothetical protein
MDCVNLLRSHLFFYLLNLWCMGPEAINLCAEMSNLTGEGPEGLKSIFELFSIGFQTNRVGMMRGPEPRTGLGARMVTGLG